MGSPKVSLPTLMTLIKVNQTMIMTFFKVIFFALFCFGLTPCKLFKVVLKSWYAGICFESATNQLYCFWKKLVKKTSKKKHNMWGSFEMTFYFALPYVSRWIYWTQSQEPSPSSHPLISTLQPRTEPRKYCQRGVFLIHRDIHLEFSKQFKRNLYF